MLYLFVLYIESAINKSRDPRQSSIGFIYAKNRCYNTILAVKLNVKLLLLVVVKEVD
jgi:hypothetical protein